MANTQIDKGLKTPDYNSPRESGDFYLLEDFHNDFIYCVVKLNRNGSHFYLNEYWIFI